MKFTLRQKLWIAFASILLLTVLAVLIDLPKGPDIIWNGKMLKEIKVHLGLDLQGGTSLTYQADLSQIPAGQEESAMDGVRDVIEQRVNAFGVSEPVVQTSSAAGNWRVIVDLPGVTDVQDAIKQIGETPLLQFKEEGSYTLEQLDAIRKLNAESKIKADDLLTQALAPNADFSALASANSQDTGTKDKGGDLGYFKKGEMVAAFDEAVFNQAEVGKVYTKLVESEYGWHIIKLVDKRTTDGVEEAQASHILISKIPEVPQSPIYANTGLSGKNLKQATVVFDPQTNLPQISLEFDADGAKLFSEITSRNIGKTVAIYLDGKIISAPQVEEAIPDGKAVINGKFTLKEAKELVQRLNSGALPVPVSLINQQTIGPSLGQASIEKSLFAGLIGLLLVALFMIIIYRLPGFISVLALIIYCLLNLAIYKLWPVTLSLAGVAGFIISIGMAVDANVLIFERTREELRGGKVLEKAIQDGFTRAWSSIRDSNLTTLIICLILYWMGTSSMKGFAITLAIGVGLSMFCALTITRVFMRLIKVKNQKFF